MVDPTHEAYCNLTPDVGNVTPKDMHYTLKVYCWVDSSMNSVGKNDVVHGILVTWAIVYLIFDVFVKPHMGLRINYPARDLSTASIAFFIFLRVKESCNSLLCVNPFFACVIFVTGLQCLRGFIRHCHNKWSNACFASLSEKYMIAFTFFSITERGYDTLRTDDVTPETNKYGGQKFVWSSKLVTNKYADISSKFGYVVLIFLGQCCLFFVYVVYMNECPAIHHNIHISVMKWIIGTLIMIIHRDECGAEFVPYVWMEIHKTIDKRSQEKKDHEYGDDDFPKPVKLSRCLNFSLPFSWEVKIRQAMSFIVNSVIFTIIVTTAPVLLSTKSADEFVVDCVALLWLTKIDDCEPKELWKAFEDRMQADKKVSEDDMKKFYDTINKEKHNANGKEKRNANGKEKRNANGKEALGEGRERDSLLHGAWR